MVSSQYYSVFCKSLMEEQGNAVSAPPHVIQIGLNAQSQNEKYWGGQIAASLIPFGGHLAGSFTTNESLLVRTFWNDPYLPVLDIQAPIMPTPSEHATIFTAACSIPAPIPFSMMVSGVSPKAFSLLKPTFLRLGTTSKKECIFASDVHKKKIAWDPILDMLNTNTQLVNTWDKSGIWMWSSEEFRNLKGKRPDDSLVGYARLLAYKGWTIIEIILAPQHQGYPSVTKEKFHLKEIRAVISATWQALQMVGRRGEDVGRLMIHGNNEALIKRLVDEIEQRIGQQSTPPPS